MEQVKSGGFTNACPIRMSYVLTTRGYGDKDKAATDAGVTASAYLGYSKMGMEDFDQLRELAKKYAKLTYRGWVPGEFNTNEMHRPLPQSRTG
ncbi:hypothetical protein IGB42_00183 [Andreprevotia sp. IGB-42]|uniref:hypothetical protein n=1 Tax=Andreprevotia sp. IGB-42 TaxID=2497473 RepID=UPI00135C4BEB|nr:hypothetical protein [Andreprevotia sp. IGB-42]KAF0815106.1 hypothetical protein IGB42_00183 [Andreprevotia sp. IGB-42]